MPCRKKHFADWPHHYFAIFAYFLLQFTFDTGIERNISIDLWNHKIMFVMRIIVSWNYPFLPRAICHLTFWNKTNIMFHSRLFINVNRSSNDKFFDLTQWEINETFFVEHCGISIVRPPLMQFSIGTFFGSKLIYIIIKLNRSSFWPLICSN